MKRIFVLNIKGGVGKTFIANEIASSLDRTDTPYSYFDLDGQGGSSHKENVIDEPLAMIADTPSAPSEADLQKWCRAADVIVIPTKSSGFDLYPLKEMLKTIRDVNPDAQRIIVQNMSNRWTTARDFGEWLEANVPDIPVLQIPQAEAVVQAVTRRKSVVESNPKSKVAKAVKEAVNVVRMAAELEREQ